ncbi:MAG TPA: MerR family transcriptional regulator [Nocardioides sp.]|uniref:MerR family transcriptional regulator n=1 Tax=uncultured Nocardioides sp. TaxID=198441 RepID=UPI000EED3425|nr:MerR family transcriptional regulator [uncultured Nocardioides sp.]HCB05366.1 MerR family transcriptional regulator [Nocardioides sp.]HRD61543.1 MerR family transcriptional regulator [Nocardioides sp.]HRI98232.1 MerR family transcriptional regulator [Nocardioides sp.]HRK47384.1 MerR family transcriptional regulator [Nocardioides sp.]
MIQGLSIAEAAELTGLSADTLRYYERDGLMLRTVPRSGSGHRQYADRDVEWIRLITKLRSTGMPIRDVRRYADLVRAGDGNEAERLELLRDHRQTVLARLAEVQDHLGAIDYKIGLYETRLAGAA